MIRRPVRRPYELFAAGPPGSPYRDEAAAIRAGGRIETGTCYATSCDDLDPQLDRTGVKDSGHGVAPRSATGHDVLHSIMTTKLPTYRDRGARALVLLHEQQLPLFVEAWHRAKQAGVRLPHTDDPNYASLEALLAHVLRGARGYMTWICEHLDLPDPRIPPAPEPDAVAGQADAWVTEALQRWRTPLSDVAPERLGDRTYISRWGQPYTIGAMLEHAVVHPMRHRLQLDELLGEQA